LPFYKKALGSDLRALIAGGAGVLGSSLSWLLLEREMEKYEGR